MSLQDNKNALFGKGPSTASGTRKPAASPSPVISSTKAPIPKPSSSISPEMKAKKMKEASENEERAQKFLKTSIFQWSPDHVAAATALDAAGSAYKAAEEYNLAITAYLRAGTSHEACDSYAASALSLQQAADLAKKIGETSQSADIYLRIANCWGLRGEVIRVGEFFCKAAKELETSDPKRAKQLYLDGINHMCPEETTVENMSSGCPAIATDIFSKIFKFLLQYRSSAKTLPPNSFKIPVDEVIAFAYRMIGMYEGLDMEASACRMRVTITLLQLEQGDVIAADRTFLDHLSSSAYLKANESKLAEEFIMAFKQMDIDLLDAAQKSHLLINLERDIQGIARSLSLLSSHNAPVPMAAATAPTPAHRPVNLNPDMKISGEEEEEGEGEFESKEEKGGKGQEEEEDFDALIGEISEPPPQANDDDEIDLT